MQGILQLLHGLNFVSHARSCPINSSVQLPINFNLIFIKSGRKQIKHFILLSDVQKDRPDIKVIKSILRNPVVFDFKSLIVIAIGIKNIYFTFVFVCVICGKSLLLILEFLYNERIQSVMFYSKNCLCFAIYRYQVIIAS